MAIQTNKQIKREKLLDQGVSMLMDQGYHGTGLKQILDLVQIPKGSFYNYFGSKEKFAAEAISHYIEPFIELLTQHLKAPGIDGLTALKNYYAELINEVEKSGYKGGCLLGNMMGEVGDTSEECRHALLKTIKRYNLLQETALLRAQQEGVVRKDRSAKSMVNLLFSNWQGALLQMKVEKSIQPLQICWDSLLDDYFKA
ncbi:MAG: TetR family transcriptional regulator C-terminal domain-containing protein [Methylococcales bacterium]